MKVTSPLAISKCIISAIFIPAKALRACHPAPTHFLLRRHRHHRAPGQAIRRRRRPVPARSFADRRSTNWRFKKGVRSSSLFLSFGFAKSLLRQRKGRAPGLFIKAIGDHAIAQAISFCLQ